MAPTLVPRLALAASLLFGSVQAVRLSSDDENGHKANASSHGPNFAAGAMAVRNGRERRESRGEANWARNSEEYKRAAREIPNMAKQPPMPADLNTCIGREGVLKLEDYHFMQGHVRDAIGGTAWEYFLPDREKSLWGKKLQFEIVPEITIGNKYALMTDVGVFKRGECCGGDAKLILDHQTEGMLTNYFYQIQCLGAAVGEHCRRRNVLGMLFGSSGCSQHTRCIRWQVDPSDGEEVGMCESDSPGY